MKAVVTLFLLICFVFSAHADGTHPRGIALDGTLGTAGELNLQGPDYNIKAEYGQQTGANLFHSFRQFNIHSDESATFNGPASVQNIIARVTGGNASWIDGKLSSAIPDANLYLMNSSGIMFGPNVLLDLSGSFHMTTADYLRLGENERLNAMSHESDVLSAAEPSAFGFLPKEDRGISPISFEGKRGGQEETGDELLFSEGKTFSVIGGDIEIKNESLIVPEGRMNMVSAASAGEVIPSASALDVSCEKMGNITISDRSLAEVKGRGSIFIRSGAFLMSDSSIKTETSGAENGGISDIQADTVSLTQGASLSASSRGQGNGGDIMIRAKESVTLSGADEAGAPSCITARSEYEGADSGDAGRILIETKNLLLKDGAWISGSTFGTGRGGDIAVRASESVNFSGNNTDGLGCSIGSASYSEKADAGNAGDILIETKQLSFTDGAWIGAESFGGGKGGDMEIHASESIGFSGNSNLGYASGIVSRTNSRESFAGDAGDILIETGNICMKDGAGVSVNTTGAGNGGSITVRASGKADFSGVNPQGENEYGLGTGVTARSESNDGNAGNGGDIVIAARELSLSGGALVAAETRGSGKGGNLTLTAAESLTLSGSDSYGNASRIVARSEYEGADGGDAGNILIESPNISLKQSAWISSSTFGGGRGGDVTLRAAESLSLSENEDRYGLGCSIGTASYNEGSNAGNGGTISIETERLSFNDGAWIGSETFGSGKGGDIFVRASESLRFSGNSNMGYANGIVSRTNGQNADAGDAGDIFIETKDLFFKDGGGVSASTLGPGNGASVTIQVSGSVELTGVNPHGRNEYGFGSGIYALSQGTSADSGNAGNISLNADSLSLTDGAFINTSTLGGGSAGSIDIGVDKSVYISGDSSEIEKKPPLSSQLQFQEVILPRADERFSVSGIYSASANTDFYAGDAGKIALTARDMTLSDSSALLTEAKNAGGGDIAIRADNFLYLHKGGIATSVRGGDGNGGDIDVSDPAFFILNRSSVVADAYGGNGGNIHIAADQFIQSEYSKVSASSKLGIDGTITIDAPSTDVSSGLTVLSGNFLNAAQWMKVPCSQRTEEKISRFVISGRDGVSAFFDDWQPSPPTSINRSKADDSETEDEGSR
jgi:filamentous hemagglutinin family protein